MKQLFLVAALSVLLSGQVMAADMDHVPWEYTGAAAAYNWGELSGNYKICSTGKKQSPVNIEEYGQDPHLPRLLPTYKSSPLNIANTGRNLLINVHPGSKLAIGGMLYNLLQFSFHTPSGHYLDGAPYPMEIQFLHQNPENGEMVLIAAMVKIGAHNKVIEAIWNNAPAAGGHREIDNFTLVASDLLPHQLNYYKYDGSLTMPPCTEGVSWYVLQTPIELSEAQLRVFQSLFPMNARPIQPLNGRKVVGQ